ncbi:hypothetical protein BKA66DRAFT_311746 [Pyrenochaeta sp. MPI-SDFR-AT-0127]|nr:hypothetical protein BKA66DRAFT_311746 [Pyrenochaeta sp. MPI-SDFR-AT-0127]
MSTHALRDTQSPYSDTFSQHPDLSCYSDSRSIDNWLEIVFAARSRSEKGRAGAALRHSRAAHHTAKSCSTATIRTRTMRDNERTNARVTRSKSRRKPITEEIVSVEVNVAALHIAEGSEGERNMEDIDNNRTAKHPPSELPHPHTAGCPPILNHGAPGLLVRQ